MAFCHCTIPCGLFKCLRPFQVSIANHCFVMPRFTRGSQMPILKLVPINMGHKTKRAKCVMSI